MAILHAGLSQKIQQRSDAVTALDEDLPGAPQLGPDRSVNAAA